MWGFLIFGRKKSVVTRALSGLNLNLFASVPIWSLLEAHFFLTDCKVNATLRRIGLAWGEFSFIPPMRGGWCGTCMCEVCWWQFVTLMNILLLVFPKAHFSMFTLAEQCRVEVFKKQVAGLLATFDRCSRRKDIARELISCCVLAYGPWEATGEVRCENWLVHVFVYVFGLC